MPLANNNLEETAETVEDAIRSSLLQIFISDLGEMVQDHHLIPGKDLWLRVSVNSWLEVAEYLKGSEEFIFFDWLSAIDWLPSPYGRSLESDVDIQLGNVEVSDPDEKPSTGAEGYAGGSSRFQVLARVYNIERKIGVTIKTDLGEDLSVATWTDVYPGAAWHEREAYEMFGITFVGHENLRNIYLPTGFEGNPLRKDYPLLARLAKPWPGIVDVEPFPETPESSAPTTTNPGLGGAS